MITDQPDHARGRSPLRGPLSAAPSFASCALNIVSWRQNLGTASSARRKCRILWCFFAAATAEKIAIRWRAADVSPGVYLGTESNRVVIPANPGSQSGVARARIKEYKEFWIP